MSYLRNPKPVPLLKALIVMAFSLPTWLFAQIIYVDADNTNSIKDGLSWNTAFSDVASALTSAADDAEIWVAEGVYYPDVVGADRDITLELPSGVRLLGGFQGDELLADERNPELNETIFSGDIGVSGDDSDNSYTILYAVDPYEGTLIDGLIFEAGMATHDDDLEPFTSVRKAGGAIYVIAKEEACRLQIRNCVFRNNRAIYAGGAIFFNGRKYPDIGPRLSHCVFRNNHSEFRGGAIAFDWGLTDSEILVSCVFEQNRSFKGGAVAIEIVEPGVSLSIRSCIFDRNVSILEGPSIWIFNVTEKTHLTIDSCAFTRDTSLKTGQAGGVYIVDLGHPLSAESLSIEVTQCTFIGQIEESVFDDSIGVGLLIASWSNPVNVTIRDCMFQSSRLYVSIHNLIGGGKLEISNTSVTNCHNSERIFIVGGFEQAEFRNVQITNNSIRYGPLLGANQSKWINCNISNNSVEDNFFISGNSIEFYNCILWGNTFDSIPRCWSDTLIFKSVITDRPDFEFVHAGNPQYEDVIVQYDNTTMFSTDPLFVDQAAGDYYIRSCSPAVNNGMDSIVTASEISTDFDLTERIVGASVDIGPYEHPNPFKFELVGTRNASCYGEHNGSVEFEFEGTQPQSFYWLLEDTVGDDTTNLEPGSYLFIFNDGEQCTDSIYLDIIEPDSLTVEFDINNIDCFGDATGLASADIKGGTPPYLIEWSNGETGSLVVGLPANDYTTLVTDAHNCTTEQSFTILEPAPIEFSLDIIQLSTEFTNDGSICVESINGGTAPYRIVWEDGYDLFCRDMLLAGTYTVQIEDSLNCPQQIEIELRPQIVVGDGITINVWPNLKRNDQTLNIRIASSEEMDFEMHVFDVSGKFITLRDEILGAGLHTLQYDDIDLPYGAYLLTFVINGHRVTVERIIVIE